jgi:hypothetical protein
MKLWDVIIEEAPLKSHRDRRYDQRKERHTAYIVHAESPEEAEKLALDNYFMDLPARPLQKVVVREGKWRCIYRGQWHVDPKGGKGSA